MYKVWLPAKNLVSSEKIQNMYSTFIMNLLLMLMAIGNPVTKSDDAYQFDFNGNGVIDMDDLLTFLAYDQPD